MIADFPVIYQINKDCMTPGVLVSSHESTPTCNCENSSAIIRKQKHTCIPLCRHFGRDGMARLTHPRRKAEGCGGKDSVDGGHGHHRLSDFYVLFNPCSNGDTQNGGSVACATVASPLVTGGIPGETRPLAPRHQSVLPPLPG